MSASPESIRFAACLRLSLDTLRLECPQAYERVCDCLAPLTVALSLEGEPVTLAFHPGFIRIAPAGARKAERARCRGRCPGLDQPVHHHRPAGGAFDHRGRNRQ